MVASRLLLRSGPRSVAAYAKAFTGTRIVSHRFANGLASALDPRDTRLWVISQRHRMHLVIVLLGTPPHHVDVGEWVTAIRAQTNAHVIVGPELAERMAGVDPVVYSVSPIATGLPRADLPQIRAWMQQYWRRCDLLLIDASQRLIDPFDVSRLQHAADQFEPPATSEIGFVVPALRAGEDLVGGWEWDAADSDWTMRAAPEVDWQHRAIPRYVLGAPAQCALIRWTTIDRVALDRNDVTGLPIDVQIRRWMANGWRQNVRTLAYAPVVVDVDSIAAPQADDFDRAWLGAPRYLDDGLGRRRVIYVLPATSVSGGIRTVFEQADGLNGRRGFDVEIWSLQGQPDWIDVDVRVKTFRSYDDLLLALRDEDPIKVATWWESTQIVWLASVNRGVAVNYVQEFETWFYPDQPTGRAAVAASYRREMANITIADYQKGELAEIGVPAETISSAYDEANFRRIDVQREPDTMLAVGRSFFQKNFAMTLAAWNSLGDRRPELLLFGVEPDLVDDERATYEVRPSSARVNELYNRATFFVQTSRHEGFSLPIIEAMAAGCPVITTDSHGNRDFCFDGVNCLMVEQDDVTALAAAIERMRADAELRHRLSAEGLHTAAMHRWSVVLDRTSQFLLSLGSGARV